MSMDAKEVLDELRTIFMSRLRFQPHRVAEVTLDTPLPKGVDGSVGLDSLDFIELSLAVEDRFGIVMDDAQDLAPHFASFRTLCSFIVERTGTA